MMETILTFVRDRLAHHGRARTPALTGSRILLPEPKPIRREKPVMLTTLVVILIVLWTVGLYRGFVMGGLIQLLLVAAMIAGMLRILTRGRSVG